MNGPAARRPPVVVVRRRSCAAVFFLLFLSVRASRGRARRVGGGRRRAGVSFRAVRASARPRRRRLTAIDDATRTGRARGGVRDGGFRVRIARGRGAVDARGGRRVWGDCVVSRGRARARAGIDWRR